MSSLDADPFYGRVEIAPMLTAKRRSSHEVKVSRGDAVATPSSVRAYVLRRDRALCEPRRVRNEMRPAQRPRHHIETIRWVGLWV